MESEIKLEGKQKPYAKRIRDTQGWCGEKHTVLAGENALHVYLALEEVKVTELSDTSFLNLRCLGNLSQYIISLSQLKSPRTFYPPDIHVVSYRTLYIGMATV